MVALPPAPGPAEEDFEATTVAMVQSLEHDHPLVNGYSGFFPEPGRGRCGPGSSALPEPTRSSPSSAIDDVDYAVADPGWWTGAAGRRRPALGSAILADHRHAPRSASVDGGTSSDHDAHRAAGAARTARPGPAPPGARHAISGPTLVDMRRRFGPVVEVGTGPFRFVYLFGLEANEHVLGSNAANFEWAPAFRLLEVVDGPTALVMSDGPDHKRRRRLVQPAFSMKRIDAHLGVIVEEVDRALDGWTPGRRFRAYDQLRDAVRRIVLRSLFGDLLGDRADEVGELLEPALRYVQRSPFTRFDRDLRVNAYARARRGVRAADAVISAEVERRRAHGIDADEHPDVLSALLVGADDEKLTDAEVLDQVRSLIAAGYDTTSAAAAWVVHALGRHPDVLDARCAPRSRR